MTFPTTSIIDNFNRSNTGPPPSASWVNGYFTSADYGGDANYTLKVDTNVCTVNETAGGGSVYNTVYNNPVEFYYTITNRDASSNNIIYLSWDILNRDTIPNGWGTRYMLNAFGDGGFNGYILSRFYPDHVVTLHDGSGETAFMDIGWKFGIRQIGADIEVWYDAGSGWTLLSTTTDPDTPLTSGYVSLEMFVGAPTPSTNISIDDFGGGEIASAPPVADFSGTPTSGDRTLTVNFTDASTNTPTSWAWTFGDGGTSTSQNPSHNYTAAGTYTVALTATNAAGSDTKTRTNYITVNPIVPVADFTADTTSGEQTLTVNFTDTTTNSPTSWAWSFGDGDTASTQNPSHNYPLQGVYTVSLTASNVDGSDTNTKVGYITVALAAPSGLTAIAQSASRIHLTWNDNSTGEVGFKIERKDSGAYAQIDTVISGVNEYMDSGLTQNTTYTYRVRAYN